MWTRTYSWFNAGLSHGSWKCPFQDFDMLVTSVNKNPRLIWWLEMHLRRKHAKGYTIIEEDVKTVDTIFQTISLSAFKKEKCENVTLSLQATLLSTFTICWNIPIHFYMIQKFPCYCNLCEHKLIANSMVHDIVNFKN